MNRGKRYAAIILLEATNVLLVHCHGALHMIVHRDARDALTDKEKAFIMKRQEAIVAVQRDLTKLCIHFRKQYNDN